MRDQITRLLLAAILLLLAALTAQPYIERQFFSAVTPRPIEPRGTLGERAAPNWGVEKSEQSRHQQYALPMSNNTILTFQILLNQSHGLALIWSHPVMDHHALNRGHVLADCSAILSSLDIVFDQVDR